MILSALYFHPSGLFKQLIITFSLTTWLSILLSIIIISLVLYQSNIIFRETDAKLFHKDANLAEIMILVFSFLLNNSPRIKDNLLLTIWSLMTLIFIACIHGNILSSLINQDMTTFHSFQEIIDSNISIIGGKWSYFDVFNKTWTDIDNFKLLINRSDFVYDYNVSYSS